MCYINKSDFTVNTERFRQWKFDVYILIPPKKELIYHNSVGYMLNLEKRNKILIFSDISTIGINTIDILIDPQPNFQ